MRLRRIALVGVAVAMVLLLSGCHRLGLVKSPATSASSSSKTAASPSTAPTGTAPANAAGIAVAVQNGGGIKGRGAAMVTRLKGLGFNPGKATNAKRTDYATTVVLYNPGHEAEATQVQKALALGKVQPAPADVTFPSGVLVIVGKDF
ncbi:MAG: LytR C-terminal domain-containing protein [Coriobacteriia bacterium]|nr:LytR C-terminal domain-containing protein [Coriobacteriia bacterium]